MQPHVDPLTPVPLRRAVVRAQVSTLCFNAAGSLLVTASVGRTLKVFSLARDMPALIYKLVRPLPHPC